VIKGALNGEADRGRRPAPGNIIVNTGAITCDHLREGTPGATLRPKHLVTFFGYTLIQALSALPHRRSIDGSFWAVGWLAEPRVGYAVAMDGLRSTKVVFKELDSASSSER
jgi:hypothetical protein